MMIKIIAIIPARGGSKAIPLKNMKKINKKPLIEYSIRNCLESKIFSKIIISSDNDNILKYCSKYKNKITILKRPENISRNNSKTEDTLLHAINTLKLKHNDIPDYICVLEPTAPLRKTQTIKNLYKFLKKKNIKSLITVSTLDHSPGLIKKKSFEFINYDRRRRQDRKKIYVETGTFYLVNFKYFLKYKKIVSRSPYPFIVSKIEATDINDYEDLEIARKLLYKKN